MPANASAASSSAVPSRSARAAAWAASAATSGASQSPRSAEATPRSRAPGHRTVPGALSDELHHPPRGGRVARRGPTQAFSREIHYRTSRAFSSQGRTPQRTPSHLRCAISFAMSPSYTNATVGRRPSSLLGSGSACVAITTSAVERSERSTAARAGIAQTRAPRDLAAAADDSRKCSGVNRDATRLPDSRKAPCSALDVTAVPSVVSDTTGDHPARSVAVDCDRYRRR